MIRLARGEAHPSASPPRFRIEWCPRVRSGLVLQDASINFHERCVLIPTQTRTRASFRAGMPTGVKFVSFCRFHRARYPFSASTERVHEKVQERERERERSTIMKTEFECPAFTTENHQRLSSRRVKEGNFYFPHKKEGERRGAGNSKHEREISRGSDGGTARIPSKRRFALCYTPSGVEGGTRVSAHPLRLPAEIAPVKYP